MKANISFQIFIGANCDSSSVDKEKQTSEFWRLSNKHPNKAVYLVKTEILATNAMGNTAMQQKG